MNEQIAEILRQVKFDWPKDYIIRFLYVKLAPVFQRDLDYFLASDEEKLRQFNQGFINKTPYIVCATISDFYVEIFKKFGIKAERVRANSAQIPLFALVVWGDKGLYFLDPLNDLFRNQYGLRPNYFGKIPRYKTINNSHPNLVNLEHAYIDTIDSALGLQTLYDALHGFMNQLHTKLASRNSAFDYFGLERNNLFNLTQRKLQFYNDKLINIGDVKGPFERALLYAYLNGKLLDHRERQGMVVKINEDRDDPSLRIKLVRGNNEASYQECFEDNKYVLKRMS